MSYGSKSPTDSIFLTRLICYRHSELDDMRLDGFEVSCRMMIHVNRELELTPSSA